MNWIDFLVLAIVLGVLSLAGFAIYRSKKQGKACIGCPDASKCAHKCSGSCSCCNH